MNIQFYWRFWAQSWEFSDLRFPYKMFTFQTSFKPFLIRGGGGYKVMNSKVNCNNLCPNYVQEFGLSYFTSPFCNCKRTRNETLCEPRNTFLGWVSAKPYQNVWARTYGYFYGRLWVLVGCQAGVVLVGWQARMILIGWQARMRLIGWQYIKDVLDWYDGRQRLYW